MRALITGISGFVGAYLAEHLLACGDDVLGTSPDGQWGKASPQALRQRVPLVHWDFAAGAGQGSEAESQIAEFRPDVVYHLAAISAPSDCGEQEPTPLAWSVNVLGTRRMLELAQRLHARLLLTSSSHVYAPVAPDAPVVREDAPLGSARAYGRTKLGAEEEVRAAVGDGADALIARAFQHTGPGQEARFMLPEWASQVARPESAPIRIRTLNAYVDVSDVRDVVRAYRLLALHGKAGEAYNVGSGVRRRSGDILAVVQQIAGCKRPVVELQPGVRNDPIADTAKLVAATGWRPEIPLEQTIADTLAWWHAAHVLITLRRDVSSSRRA